MKTYIITSLFLIALLFLNGCKKNDLPPTRCYQVNVNTLGWIPSPIDSVVVTLTRIDVKNKNYTGGFKNIAEFCGLFSYKVEVFNPASNPEFGFYIGTSTKELGGGGIKGNATFEGTFIYNQGD
jgi:hypothetical protein